MKSIRLGDEKADYEVRYSRRARCVRLVVKNDASIIVTLPRGVDAKVADSFVREKAGWLLRKIKQMRARTGLLIPGGSRDAYLKHKSRALDFIAERLSHFNKAYGFKIAKITVRNQKTRWGSCSRRGNLSFNFKILFLPPDLADYIIVHELCHLGEFNHQRNFWSLVGKTIPEHKQIIKRMKGLII